MHHRPRDVRHRSKCRIPNNIEVREAGQAERITEATTTGALDVDDQFCVARQSNACVDRPEAR